MLADRTPTPLELRAEAAQRTLDRFKDQPFEWGKFDCVRLTAYHLRQMGYRPKLPPTGYRSARSAKTALAKAGFASLTEAMDRMGFERVAPAATLVGDVIEWPSEHPDLGALAVQLGNGRSIAFHQDAPGATIIQVHEWRAAWRVNPK